MLNTQSNQYRRFPWNPVALVCVTGILMGVMFLPKATDASSMLKVGLLQEPKTLNIWLASDSWSHKVLRRIYSNLYIRDPETMQFVPWLAEAQPVYDEETLSYTVKLRDAKWSDGSDFTSGDVAFTGRLIQEFKVPRYYSKWKFVKKIETPDKHTVRFYLEEPKAIFITRTLTAPIVQEKKWTKIAEEARGAEKPVTTLLNYNIEKPVGTGPFVLEEWRKGAYVFLKRNEHFFGRNKVINGRKLGPFLGGIICKVFGTSDAAILALKKGTIDMFWWDIQAGYLEELKEKKGIRLFTNEKSALYYMGFNCRTSPFKDVNLRRASAMLIDKDFIINRILQGYAVRMKSVVPPGNTYWHCPDVPDYGVGLTKSERIRQAYKILKEAGYTWETPPVDSAGKVVKAEGLICPDGNPMKKFTILTPPADYDPNRAMAGMMIQGWLREAGMPAYARPMAFGSLLEKVKVSHDFDAYILGYGKLSLDPDYVRYFFHSRYLGKRGLNKSGYNNPEFDRIADKSASAMVKERRRDLIWEMQKIIVRDLPFVPLYNPKLLEAVREDSFTGWVEMLGGIGNTWSFCQLQAR